MRRKGLAKRIVSTTLAAVLCVGMMGNVPMVSMAQEDVEIETETATGSDADFGAGFETDGDVEAPAFVDESEETTQEETDEEIIEDEEPSLTATAGDWEYSDNDDDDGTVTITGYMGSDTEVVIPEQIDGKTVTEIGDSAFASCSSLASIEIPSGVTSIGYGAFYKCSNLTSIEIPSSVTSIGSSAFNGCSNLVSIDVNADNASYKSINGILYDGDIETLICCPEGIKGTIHIPESVTSIGDSAFEGCSSLTSIEFPEGVTSIGDSAFEYCSSLTSIEIPSSVTNIGNSAFNGCSNLVSIDVNADNASYKSINGILYDGDIETLICCPEEIKGTIHIPESVTSIGDSAFEGCSSLTSIEFPEGVLSIGWHAFERCSSLTSIEIPTSVTSIGSSAFAYCSSLTSIEIPTSVTSVGWYAFEGCSSLKSIEIPEGVTSIGHWAFMGCSSLVSIDVNANNASYKSINGILYDGNIETLICCPGGIKGTVHIPESVTGIEGVAFWGCSSLTSIEIPSSVTSIGQFAFEGCSSLKSIEIPSGVTSIEWGTFEGCSSLTNIEIPLGVTSIGSDAFEGCSSLTSIKIPLGVTNIEWGAFEGCSSLTSIVIPSSVTSIGIFAFNNCYNITIYGFAGTTSEAYAKENNIPFVPLCEESDLSKVTVVADSVTYNGDYQTAEPYIMYKNNKYPLVEDVDYTGTVKGKAAGTTTVKITGKGDYTGETTVSFTVNPLHLKNALEAGDVVFTAGDLEYTGRLLYSPVKVTYKGKALKEGTDYTLKGNGRKAVGTSWAVVTGTGNYTGTIKVKYAMKKATQPIMLYSPTKQRTVNVRNANANLQLKTSRIRENAEIVYSVEKPNQGITVSQDGKVTVKKGTKPGKYRIKVLAKSTQYYKATSKYYTIVVK